MCSYKAEHHLPHTRLSTLAFFSFREGEGAPQHSGCPSRKSAPQHTLAILLKRVHPNTLTVLLERVHPNILTVLLERACQLSKFTLQSSAKIAEIYLTDDRKKVCFTLSPFLTPFSDNAIKTIDGIACQYAQILGLII